MSLQDQFIKKLEEKYGAWDKVMSKFGTTSFGEVAKALSISASQFSKLIYGTATEGMYARSIENINRLLQRESIREERDKALTDNLTLQKENVLLKKKEKISFQRVVLFSFLSLLLGGALAYFHGNETPPKTPTTLKSNHPLATFFDLDFDASFYSPYLNISEVQDYCPCSAFEGVWSLDRPYKLPLPTGKPGVYYYGKNADVRMKCTRFDTVNVGKGRVLLGYEYLTNEIWVDTKMTPLSPTYFDKNKKTFTPTFDALVFEQTPHFKKVATIHSFFTDKFEIYNDSIVRKGEPCGRYASDVDEELAGEFGIDIEFLVEQVLSDFTTTSCAATTNPFCDPNDLKEKESVFSFDCDYTIKLENLGLGGSYPYSKGYRLEKQIYSGNMTCGCE